MVPHPIEACYGSRLHCFSHDMDEPLAGYRICIECRHVFATAGDLLREHNRVLAGLNEHVDPAGDPLFAITEPIPPETDVNNVFCCPFCAHDW